MLEQGHGGQVHPVEPKAEEIQNVATRGAIYRPIRQRIGDAIVLLAPFVIAGVIWEVVALLGVFPEILFPSVHDILRQTGELLASGLLIRNTVATVIRLLEGTLIGVSVGLIVGLGMSQSRLLEGALAPVFALLLPIPSLTWVPLFILWFGIGETPVIILAAFAAGLPMVVNTWTGMKSVQEIWLRAGMSMGAQGLTLFRKVILPGALPQVITGLRLGLGQGWRAVVAGEMLAAPTAGLGWMIFNSREFLQTKTMLAGVIAIGILGVLMEKVFFQKLEDITVVRWGMMRG